MILDDPNFENPPSNFPIHKWFLRSAILLLLFNILLFFSKSNPTIDIQMHDTYFVIALVHISISFSLFLFFLFGIYAFFYYFGKIQLNILLSKIHYYLTTLSMAGILFASLITYIYIFQAKDINLYKTISWTMSVLFFIFLLAQVLFLINLIRTIYIAIISKD